MLGLGRVKKLIWCHLMKANNFVFDNIGQLGLKRTILEGCAGGIGIKTSSGQLGFNWGWARKKFILQLNRNFQINLDFLISNDRFRSPQAIAKGLFQKTIDWFEKKGPKTFFVGTFSLSFKHFWVLEAKISHRKCKVMFTQVCKISAHLENVFSNPLKRGWLKNWRNYA